MRVGWPSQRSRTGRWWVWLAIALVILIGLGDRAFSSTPPDIDSDVALRLPPAQVHPLPPALAEWHDPTSSGDYFEAIAPSRAGYLVWSTFPLRVFIEAEESAADVPPSIYQRWREVIWLGLQSWGEYLPIQAAPTADGADIVIWATPPPLQVTLPDGSADRLILGRSRNAETRYRLRLHSRPDGETVLIPHYDIFLSPGQGTDHLTATARHEMGHALGLWGHSPVPSDALYAAQVRSPPTLSARDLNTLKRVYQQPTRLGWPVEIID